MAAPFPSHVAPRAFFFGIAGTAGSLEASWASKSPRLDLPRPHRPLRLSALRPIAAMGAVLEVCLFENRQAVRVRTLSRTVAFQRLASCHSPPRSPQGGAARKQGLGRRRFQLWSQ